MRLLKLNRLDFGRIVLQCRPRSCLAMFAGTALMLLLVFGGCSPSSPAPERTLFVKLDKEQTGVDFANLLQEEPLFNSINYLYFYDGGGVAVGDINNDGLLDLYFTANQQENRLYLNRGNFQFEDITEQAGVGGGTEGWSTGVTMADVNGDGLLDIYVCRSNYLDRKGANQLFINNGDLTFREEAARYGLDFQGLSRQAVFFDYDLDGDLDLYLLNHSVHSKRTYGDIGLREKRDYEAGDKLFRNEGGKFVNVTREAGIYESFLGYGLGVAVGDVNLDGLPDIYICNDFHEDDYLYYNNGDGTFTEALRQSMGHISSASMGNDMADFNNDGLLDIVVMDMLPEDERIRKSSLNVDPFEVFDAKLFFGYYPQYRRNTLQLNRGIHLYQKVGKGRPLMLFSEIGQLAGVHMTDWSWAPLFVDLDNNGWKDLFVTNGIYRRPNDLDYLAYIKAGPGKLKSGGRPGKIVPEPIPMEELEDLLAHMPSVPIPNYAFQNQKNLTFRNRAREWGLADPGFSSGAAYADLDNDGDMDLVVNNVNAPAGLYRNQLYEHQSADTSRDASATAPHYLKVKLEGNPPNVFGVGARVELYLAGGVQVLEQNPVRGFQSSVDPVLHFGLGNASQVDSVIVRWPNRSRQVFRNVRADQTLLARQAEAEKFLPVRRFVPQPIFEDVTAKVELPYRHRETRFVEFNREPFIPRYVSTEGPAFARGDVNGDGLDDLFLGGAKFQRAALFFQTPDGGFVQADSQVFLPDARSEDVDAVFFDANNDGWLDLYVVSGGNEFWGKAPALRDRLYLNMGKGNFRKAEDALPEIYANGSCARPADLDGDGDLDLFVGTRSIAWHYGLPPDHYLLINNGEGQFLEASAQLAPELKKLGMVTDACWVDIEQDGDPDLVLAGDWMPITVFENRQGKLALATEKFGLQNSSGWWNVLQSTDLNGDGYPDLIAGNLGLNSILKTSPQAPVQLFVQDLTGDQRPEQILTYVYQGKRYPLPDLDLLWAHIPLMKEKFKSYAQYAGKTIDEVLPSQAREKALVLEAKEFATTVFINQRGRGFSPIHLPLEAQFSPIYAIAVQDFDLDGIQDILLGGNLSGVGPEQGQYDADYGTLLLGQGDGQFRAATLQESGIIVRGEIRGFGWITLATGQHQLVVVRNNDRPLFFRKRAEKATHLVLGD